jgi:hypothetical protein
LLLEHAARVRVARFQLTAARLRDAVLRDVRSAG